MSQIPNPANATSDCSSNNHFGIKKEDRVSTHLQLSLTFSKRVNYQKSSRLQRQRMTFKAKALALVIAVSMVSGLTSRASASYSIEQSLPELGSQAQQARIDNSEDIVSGSPSQLPLTLMIETIIASLLLVH
jgi:hypothetical protein